MLILQLLLHLLTSYERRHELDAVFVIEFFGPSKFCPSCMDILSLRIPTCNIRNILLYCINPQFKPDPLTDVPML